ncbi:MAG: PTS sugar transporter subunit IIA [Planctomycetaceae bacterium]
MKFSDFVATDAIRSDVESTTKEAVIREMAQALVDAGRIKPGDYESIVRAILNREQLGSTGIGRGVAVPHTKHPSVTKLVGTVAVSHDGIDFDSLDGDPVQLIFLLVSPPHPPGDHLRALENISRQLRDDVFCRELKAARTPTDIQHLLEAADGHGVVS